MGLNRFSLEAGKIRTLFGVEADWSLPYIDERKNVLRTTPSGNGARVVVDNLRSFLMEISLLKCDPPTHEGKLPAPETTGIATESSERSLATLRLMTDSGSETLNRLFASAMSDNYHRHRYGLGILSVQPNGTQTIVEWIRQQQTPHFEQIWEIEYWQPHSRPLATHAKFSGHHRISRTFSFGQVYFPSQFQDHLQTAMILFFHQDTTGQKKHRWRFVVELAAKI
ncbi:MAG: hypothetical protein OXT67_07370 [Zetaproteobacteria bacterium]|nr:hypothetical protein [Zetaproteobacteria bacterium]